MTTHPEKKHMDTNKFFRLATLSICGNLQIEKAMHNFINSVNELFPVNKMFIGIYEKDIGAMRTMALASSQGGKKCDQLTPMPQAVRDIIELKKETKSQNSHINVNLKDRPSPFTIPIDRATIVDPDLDLIAKEMLRVHKIENWSVIRMLFLTEDGRVASVAFSAEGPNRYKEEHVEMVTLLKEPISIALANTMKHREIDKLRERLADDNQFLQRELHRIFGDEIVGANFGLKRVMQMVHQVAATESAVLLTGETGVGKDIVANAIHMASGRPKGPFIAVNCGAIPETLLDSELFGHEKGAFTGALTCKRGRFERAHQGTIFLDEIGEMPLSAQIRLLRVLQNREIERIGGTERIPVDIRILAATNQDLEKMVRTGRFREDLWFRINVFPIEIPPLRERRCDIPALTHHFIERKARELKLGHTPVLAEGAIDTLLGYTWPGNVRELENLVERAMIIYRDEPLQFDLLGPRNSNPTKPTASRDDSILASLDEVIKTHIHQALTISKGKVHGPGGAGELLSINPNTLRHRMRNYKIPFKKMKNSMKNGSS